MNLIDEQFFIDDSSGGLTTLSRLNDSYREVAQKLLNHYVRLQVIVYNCFNLLLVTVFDVGNAVYLTHLFFHTLNKLSHHTCSIFSIQYF